MLITPVPIKGKRNSPVLPLTMPISRLDETKAAREQNVCGVW